MKKEKARKRGECSLFLNLLMFRSLGYREWQKEKIEMSRENVSQIERND